MNLTSQSFFPPPSNLDEVIWRYMDFPKYVSLLTKQCLYLSRSDLLGDPFEGSYPLGNKTNREKRIVSRMKEDKDKTDLYSRDRQPVMTFKVEQDKMLEFLSKFHEDLTKCAYVNCWHVNEHESAGMWYLYSKDSKGIAVRSTYKRLRQCLSSDNVISNVKYIDFNKEIFSESNFLNPFFYKRISYQHESELRVVQFKLNYESYQKGAWKKEEQPKGFYEPIDINQLIDSVYLAPYSEDWYEELIIELTRRLGFADIKVKRSPLETAPFY